MITYLIFALALIIVVTYVSKQIELYSTHIGTKKIVSWFNILMIVNIIITTFIIISYSTIKFKQGPLGPKGRRGKSGSQGRSGTCKMCGPKTSGLKMPEKFKIDQIDPLTNQEEKNELFPERVTDGIIKSQFKDEYRKHTT